MKRRTLILTAATLGLGALAATATLAQGPGYGNGMGHMQGQMGQGQMGQGQMGGMQGQMGGHGHGHGYGSPEDCPFNKELDKPLTADDVRTSLEQRLQRQGNDRLKVGKVEDKDDKTILAEIVTVDDSLVERIEIDKATGRQLRAK